MGECRVAAGFVDEFVAGLAVVEPLGGSERSCVRDVFLGLSGDERAGLTAAAFVPSGEGSEGLVAGLVDAVAGCGVVLEGEG